jgi:hypothetical protein
MILGMGNPIMPANRQNPMIVHLYAQCWNDEWMLPFFFRHYDALVDQYFIYDDGSTDATWPLLQRHPKVTARRFVRSTPDSFALSEKAFSDQCWKQSRGEADWVIVTDIDEHLYHRAGRHYLSCCTADGITMIPALGFQMMSEKRPEPDENLVLDYTIGAPWVQMMKPSIFNPEAIAEINFDPGRHMADPAGNVVVPRIDEMVLFHYKYMGFEQTLRRHRELQTGLGSFDLQQGWGHKYSWSEEKLKEDWQELAGRAIDTKVLRDDPAPSYPIRPWWEKYRG